jgi:carbon storage regulator
MLVISRRPGESLFIGDDIEVELLEISPSQVKLGIRAPRQVAVLRKEILLTADQNRVAAQTRLKLADQ